MENLISQADVGVGISERDVDVVVIRYDGDNVTGELKKRLEANIADIYTDGSIAIKNPDGTIQCVRHTGRWLRKDTFDEYIDAIKNRLNDLKMEKRNGQISA